MNKILYFGVFSLSLITLVVFLASCVITLSDGQGALVFVFSIPAMTVLLLCADLLSQKIKSNVRYSLQISYLPKALAALLAMFFVFSFIPGLRKIPGTFLDLVNRTFTYSTGKTPYVFFKDQASLPNRLSNELKKKKKIVFSDIDVTFAWETVCIFGPYTNNEKAKSVLNLNDWNIEDRSEIHFSDSINALVFLYRGSVNHVVDLKRSITDFKDLDICLNRNKANFEVNTDVNGRKMLSLIKDF